METGTPPPWEVACHFDRQRLMRLSHIRPSHRLCPSLPVSYSPLLLKFLAYILPAGERDTDLYRCHTLSRQRTADASNHFGPRTTSGGKKGSGHFERGTQRSLLHGTSSGTYVTRAAQFTRRSSGNDRIVRPAWPQLRRTANLLSRFKPTSQLATPPPDSPTEINDATTPSRRPKLSPFASMLLKQTEVHYQRKSAVLPWILH